MHFKMRSVPLTLDLGLDERVVIFIFDRLACMNLLNRQAKFSK